MTPTARDLVSTLELAPHPEGGWYREIHRSSISVQSGRGPRSAVTTIHYLLTAEQVSRWHEVSSDEIWHFEAGSPLELLAYHPETRVLQRNVLGSLEQGHRPVVVIAAGIWQAARSLGAHTLAGCTVGPGFDFEDFRFVKALPGHEIHFHRGELQALAALL
jgi:predicted cupin superfamily sugar epimerase